MSEYFYVKGYNGEIVRNLIPEDKFDIGEKIISLDHKKMIPNRRFIERDFFNPEDYWNELEEIYREWANFGKFGDIIFIRESFLGSSDDIIFIGWLEYKKPTLASDILPFIRDAKGEIYYVGILKKDKRTGEFSKALIGGIRDMKKYYFESALEAAIRELREETGLKINPFNVVSAGLVKNPNTTEVLMYTIFEALGSKMSTFVMRKIGSYWTDKCEKHKATETKRVNMTTAFSFLMDLNQEISPKELKTFFTAGDDADDIFIWNVADGIPDFRLSNHRKIYKETVEKLKI